MDIKALSKSFEKRKQAIIQANEEELNKVPLWNHQKTAIKRAKGKDYFALFFDVGAGKTRTIIEILKDKYEEHGFLNTLVLCPLIVVENFKRELQKFGLPDWQITTLLGNCNKRAETVKKLGKGIIVTNFEGLFNPPLVKALKNWQPDILVIDELHKIKNPVAARTKLSIEFADNCQFRYGLSGTPILNTQLDLFSQVRLLDGGEHFGKNFFVFRTKYFMDVNAARKGTHSYFPKWQPRPGIDRELRRIIQPFSMSVKKVDCLDLPPLVKKQVYVDLGPEQKRLYEQMKKEFITFLNDNVVTAELAVTKALRLQQIVSGFIKTEEGVEIELKDVPRISAVCQILEDITPHHKIIIWASYKKNYEMLEKACNMMKVKYSMLHGETNDKQNQIDKFQLDAATRVMIANPGAGGIGINLTAASYSLYYSKSFSLEHDIQSEARNYRGGSEVHESVTRIDLIAKDTIDEIVDSILVEKKKIGDNVLGTQDIVDILKKKL